MTILLKNIRIGIVHREETTFGYVCRWPLLVANAHKNSISNFYLCGLISTILIVFPLSEGSFFHGMKVLVMLQKRFGIA